MFGTHFSFISAFMSWLALHKGVAYLVLFLGMYFETLIGTSFVVPGELFLLSGPILAGTGMLGIGAVALSLYSGAALGDSSDYFIGRLVGPELFKEGRRIFNPKNYERGKKLFDRFGPKAIFLARLIGPFNLITPFLSGVYRVPYRTFLMYNLAGIIVGVGEFILIGYYFGIHYSAVFLIFHRYFLLLIALIIALFAARWYLHAERKGKGRYE